VFSDRQAELIVDVFDEAAALLGSNPLDLDIPEADAVRLGLNSPMTYGQAYRLVATGGSPAKARDYVRAVLALRRDKRVQGKELNPPPAERVDRSHWLD